MSHIKNQVIAAEKNKAYFDDLLARFPNLYGIDAELPIVVYRLGKSVLQKTKINKKTQDLMMLPLYSVLIKKTRYVFLR